MEGNLLTALRIRGIPVNVGRDGEITICCPFCHLNGKTPDTDFKLGINVISNKAHCFRCDFKTRHAKEALRKPLELGELLPYEEKPKEEKPKKIKLPEDFNPLPKCRKQDFLYTRAYRYLLQRGIDDECMEQHEIGVSLSGEYAYRIVIPVVYEKKLVGIVGRDFTGTQDKRKYLNNIGVKAIYGIPEKRAQSAILVEGIFDAWRVSIALRHLRFRRPDCLALLGHDLTEEQEQMLKGYKRITLWPDGDIVGCKGFAAIGDKLKMFFKVSVVYPHNLGEDPGSMSNGNLAVRNMNKSPWTPWSAQRLTSWAVFQ